MLFVAIVREGSFTKAARLLGITKQTASERLGKLEERLGVRLLERTTRRLRVTDAGGRYHERCSAIAAQIEEANREARRQQVEPSGLLRLSAPVLYGRRYLAPVVAGYLARYPGTRVEVILADRRVNLVEEGIDLAIRIGELDDSALAVRKLGDAHAYYVASPGFLGGRGVSSAAELRGVRCVGMRPVEIWEAEGERWKVEPLLVVNDLEVACEAAVAGVGVARLPAIVCREAVAEGRLRVLLGASSMLRPIFAVFPDRKHLPARVRVFLEMLGTLVAPMLPLDLGEPAVAPGSRRPRTAR